MTEEVKLRCIKGGVSLNEIVVIDVAGGPSNILIIKATSTPSLFGIDPQELPQVEVEGQSVFGIVIHPLTQAA